MQTRLILGFCYIVRIDPNSDSKWVFESMVIFGFECVLKKKFTWKKY